jgi:hypothetical protein
MSASNANWAASECMFFKWIARVQRMSRFYQRSIHA